MAGVGVRGGVQVGMAFPGGGSLRGLRCASADGELGVPSLGWECDAEGTAEEGLRTGA